MKLDEKYEVRPDTVGWILDRKEATKAGKSFGKQHEGGKERHRLTYHGTLEQALKAYVDSAAHEHADTAEDVLRSLKSCQIAIEAACAR